MSIEWKYFNTLCCVSVYTVQYVLRVGGSLWPTQLYTNFHTLPSIVFPKNSCPTALLQSHWTHLSLSLAISAYSFNPLFISLISSPTIYCSGCRSSDYPHSHLRIRPTLVLPEILCPATDTVALYADAVPLTSALSAYFVHPEISSPITGIVPLDSEAIPRSSSPACVFLSYRLYILLISSLTHLLCGIY